MTEPDDDWRSRGACRTADPDLFFPVSSSGMSNFQLRQAKVICGRCPVKAQCLEFALATHQVHGVWGGTSERERTRMRARWVGGHHG
jgi:WhiB family transcriptional regulator, redox-sensing transcriptional regulator